jgi:hypothetical protein
MQVERVATPRGVITATICGEDVVISARLYSMVRAADRIAKTAVVAAALWIAFEVAKAILSGAFAQAVR